jgi:hypothetical protein
VKIYLTIKNITLIKNLGKSGMGCNTDDSGGFCTEDGAGIRIKVNKAADSGNTSLLRYNRLKKNGQPVWGSAKDSFATYQEVTTSYF